MLELLLSCAAILRPILYLLFLTIAALSCLRPRPRPPHRHNLPSLHLSPTQHARRQLTIYPGSILLSYNANCPSRQTTLELPSSYLVDG